MQAVHNGSYFTQIAMQPGMPCLYVYDPSDPTALPFLFSSLSVSSVRSQKFTSGTHHSSVMIIIMSVMAILLSSPILGEICSLPPFNMFFFFFSVEVEGDQWDSCAFSDGQMKGWKDDGSGES